MSTPRCATSSPTVRERRRRGAVRLHAEVRPGRPRRHRSDGDARRHRGGLWQRRTPQTLEALTLARDRIRAHHARQQPADDRYIDPIGVELGTRWTAIEAVGLYVPGGTASYPSSVLMNAVPAVVAGVERIVMVVPAQDGAINPLVLVAADLAGVSEIYRVGGAQAIAALAYGTQTHPAGRQDRRPGQRLCRRRQAPGVRHGRHRHDRRPVGGAGRRRRQQRSRTGSRPTFWRRPSTTSSAQSILITDDAGFADARRGRRSSAS